jgi:hypothetical protein
MNRLRARGEWWDEFRGTSVDARGCPRRAFAEQGYANRRRDMGSTERSFEGGKETLTDQTATRDELDRRSGVAAHASHTRDWGDCLSIYRLRPNAARSV